MNSKKNYVSNVTIPSIKKRDGYVKLKLNYRCIQILGIHVALKHSRPEMQVNMSGGLAITAIREIALLRELKHPNIVELLDVIHCDNNLFLVFELCDTDLRHFMKQQADLLRVEKNQLNLINKPFLPLPKIKSITRQIVSALSFCHSRRIMHRDLKPQNILLNMNGCVAKLGDLGLARSFTDGAQLMTNEVVTLWYRAPELLLGDHHYTCSLDIWSLGCIIAEMFTGKPLFYGACETDTLLSVFQILGTPIEPPLLKDVHAKRNNVINHAIWKGVSKLSYYQNLFPQWTQNPSVTLKKIIPYASDSVLDLLIKLLQYDPKCRLPAREILKHPWFSEND
ncbi:cyclin-dependent kinase 3-like isoform X2 [Hylaeus volcanicus]|uniref:cyclin-dependent kinase 3-like isoform X2 n=1 Tax=Hylaeus volcanicus TaxID=313075 RepID=UPI0023B8325A|nr:cyclin-dependent kinase 3-like isoform X2 [Hylaeus volcanicus]